MGQSLHLWLSSRDLLTSGDPFSKAVMACFNPVKDTDILGLSTDGSTDGRGLGWVDCCCACSCLIRAELLVPPEGTSIAAAADL